MCGKDLRYSNVYAHPAVLCKADAGSLFRHESDGQGESDKEIISFVKKYLS